MTLCAGLTHCVTVRRSSGFDAVSRSADAVSPAEVLLPVEALLTLTHRVRDAVARLHHALVLGAGVAQ